MSELRSKLDGDFTCPDCGGPKAKKAARCATCTYTEQGLTNPPVFNIASVTCPQCGSEKSPASKLCAACRDANDDRPFPLGGPERARYGCTVTFENANGKTLTLHRAGPVRSALALVCDDALALDPTFLVIAISTPESVYTDLQGPRSDISGNDARYGHARLPEAAYLHGKLAKLLHPRLIRS